MDFFCGTFQRPFLCEIHARTHHLMIQPIRSLIHMSLWRFDVTCENVKCSRIFHSFLGKKGKLLNLCDDTLSSEFLKPQSKHEYGKGQFYYWRLIWISLTDVGNVFPMRLLIDFYTPKHINISGGCKSFFIYFFFFWPCKNGT